MIHSSQNSQTFVRFLCLVLSFHPKHPLLKLTIIMVVIPSTYNIQNKAREHRE